MNEHSHHDLALEPNDGERLANLCGPFDEHLRQIELRVGVEIANRGNLFRVTGAKPAVKIAERVLRHLYDATENETLSGAQINLHLSESGIDALDDKAADGAHEIAIKVKRGTVKGRGANQIRYLHAIASNDINFGVGPAGTGKTYLAVAMAVDALNENRVQRLILVRPAVEAGEKLGFLPGDLTQKVDPYLRPLYDALYEMLGIDRVTKLIERSVIEIAPLAYMRGRTLNDAFVILDEAQNTTVEQMKMFLTRIGFGSIAVVTGDVTQTDLPRHVQSGLRDAIEVLREVAGISFTFFTAKDVVRHPLVQRIVRAYEAAAEFGHSLIVEQTVTSATRVLLIPGLWNSGPENWQSYWQRDYGFERVAQRDWETPDRAEWVETLQRAITTSTQPAVLVGHSLGCSLIAHWAAEHSSSVRGALLVAPSDAEAPTYPPGTTGFTPMPSARLAFPSIVAASRDDPYVSLARAREFSQAWGAQLEIVGTLGHINADSRLGAWPQGLALLERLRG